jgi:hypothetical protein
MQVVDTLQLNSNGQCYEQADVLKVYFQAKETACEK